MRLASTERVVIVGASLAGIRAAETLRREGFPGRIVLVGAEAHLPYDRPPLTKQFLRGEVDEERLAIRPRNGLEPLELEFLLGRRAVSLDDVGQRVGLDDGSELEYEGLIVATGGRARTLLQGAAASVTIRTLEDARHLQGLLGRANERLVVIGGGFLGLEAAASARELGAEVVVIEVTGAPLERVLGRDVGAALGAYHEARGVEVRVGTGVVGVSGAAGERLVSLDDGSEIAASAVLAAIGMVPETTWLEGSGLELADGLVCDERLRAGPAVVGAGDVVRWPSARAGGMLRLEHWTNAAEQAVHAARELLGREPGVYDPLAYFWSDQYDLKLLGLGLPSSEAQCALVQGSFESARFVCCYGVDDRLVGAVGLNMARQLMSLRPALEAGASFSATLEAQKRSAESAGTV